MKKRFFMGCVLSFAVLFAAMAVCFAGSIPEDLLSGENAMVYFGEIQSLDGERISVIQRQNVKGDFAEGREIAYEAFSLMDGHGAAPETGTQYLCGFFDENNPLYIWTVSGFDTATLTLGDGSAAASGDSTDQTARMQEYLNNGDFAEAEQARLAAIEAAKQAAEPSKAPAATPAPAPTAADDGVPIWLWPLCSGAAILLAVFWWHKRTHG